LNEKLFQMTYRHFKLEKILNGGSLCHRLLLLLLLWRWRHMHQNMMRLVVLMAADDHMLLLLLLLLGLHFLQLLLDNHYMLFVGWQSPYSSSSGGISTTPPTAGCVSLNVAAQFVAVDEFFFAHVTLEVLHAEMHGTGVDGQAFFPIKSFPTVVAHEAGVVFVLPQMALEYEEVFFVPARMICFR
jgi:hypothetical protein